MAGTIRMLLLAGLAVAGTAHAQQARRPPADGSARLQQQVQQLASERTALQSENARLKEQVARLEMDAGALAAEKDALVRRAGAAEGRLGRAESSQQTVAARLDATEARLGELLARYRELAEQLRTVESERNRLASRTEADGQALDRCATRNVQLAAIAGEALDRYEKKGCFGALAQAEPFTGLKRVEVENAVEESRQRIEALAVPAGAGAEDKKPE